MLFGLVPLLVVVVGFRDRPSRYGLTLGEWRWGSALMLVGCAVMTPIVLWFATLPDVRAYYAPERGAHRRRHRDERHRADRGRVRASGAS